MDFSLFLLNAFASEAINCLNAAIDIYTDMVRPALLERLWGGALRQLTVNWDVTAVFPPQGRFTIAAKHHITIAEIYETELVDIEKVHRWGKLVGGDPRRPCGGDTRAEGNTRRWGPLETSGGSRRETPCQGPRLPLLRFGTAFT